MFIQSKHGLVPVVKDPRDPLPQGMASDALKIDDIEIRLGNHEGITIKYMDPNGKISTIRISTSHLVVQIEHVETNACMLLRPGVGAQFLEGTK